MQSFFDALDKLDGVLVGGAADAGEVRQAFADLVKDMPDDPTADTIRRLFRICYGFAGADTGTRPPKMSPQLAERVNWSVNDILQGLFHDKDGDYRRHVLHHYDHCIALGKTVELGRFEGPLPVRHVPLTLAEATELAAPYFAAQERMMADRPLHHFQTPWLVLQHPVAPFDRVFEAWLKDIEARGLAFGDSHTALRRALAFARLADEAQQRVSRDLIDTEILPLLAYPNPLLAAAAARFLGAIYAEPERMVSSGTLEPLPEMLHHIAVTPAATRRYVAGGFLMGFDIGQIQPFYALRADKALEGFDIDGWTLAVLSESVAEAYIPSAQAFWFYVHEGYCFEPAFIMRLIDDGHLFEAMMCATETHGRVDGMEPVLLRLTTSQDKEAAAGAAHHLASVYGTAR